MNEKLKNSLASVEMEGFTFTGEQIEFICNIVERIERRELTWDEAIIIVKARHSNENNRE